MKSLFKLGIAALILSVSTLLFADAIKQVSMNNAKDHRDYFGVTKYEDAQGKVPGIDKVRVAVIDQGFKGMVSATGAVDLKYYLPKTSKGYVSYEDVPDGSSLLDDYHGTSVALAIRGIAGDADIRFYNGRGLKNLKKAFNLATFGNKKEGKDKRYGKIWTADIIVYANTFSTMGDGQGQGDLPELIQMASDEGKIVIVAAGNDGMAYGNYSLKLKTFGDTDWFVTPNNDLFLNFTVDLGKDPAPDQKADVQIDVNWDDASGSAAGLDLSVRVYKADDLKTPIAEFKQQNKKQIVGEENPLDGESNLASETLIGRLPPGKYKLSIFKESGSPAPDQKLRVRIADAPKANEQGDIKRTVKFESRTEDGELGSGADSKYAIVVGATTDLASKGPTLDRRGKPDVLLTKYIISLSNNYSYAGSTVSTGFFAGIVAVMKALKPDLTAEDILAQRTDELPSDLIPKDFEQLSKYSRLRNYYSFVEYLEDLGQKNVGDLYAHKNDYDQLTIMVDKPIPELIPSLANLKNSTKEHGYLVQVVKTPQWEWRNVTKYEDYTVKELVRKGYWPEGYWKEGRVERRRIGGEYYGSANSIFGPVDLYTVPQIETTTYPDKWIQPDYVEPLYRDVVKTKTWQVRERFELPDQISYRPLYSDGAFDMNTVLKKYGGRPEDYASLAYMKKPSAFGKNGIVEDGTKNQGRFWPKIDL